MNNPSKILIGLLFAATLTGCAIRPLPEDRMTNEVPGESEKFTVTMEIVQRIRCEARHAIAKVSMGFIENDLLNFRDNAKTAEEKALLAEMMVGDEFYFDRIVDEFYHLGKWNPKTKEFVPGEFDSRVTSLKYGSGESKLGTELRVLAAFANSGVGYQFDFEITENNDVIGGVIDFRLPFNLMDRFDVGLSGDHKRERKNKRTFTIVERIQDIVFDRELSNAKAGQDVGYNGQCNEHSFDERTNRHYPIYGKIDLFDSFSTFAGLVVKLKFGNNQIDGFNDDSKTGLAKYSSQDLTDVITFTTEITGSVKPAIVLDAIPNTFRLIKGEASFTGKRLDTHKLTLILQQKNVVDILDKLELERLRNSPTNTVTFAAN